MSDPAVVVAAGGTGGHLVPAIAVADAVRRIAPGVRVSFIGGTRGMEGELVPAAGYRISTLDVLPWSGGLQRVVAPAAAVRAAVRARAILREERAGVVVGMGGYPSLPAILAARTMRIPALVHEQNAVLGKANRVAAALTPHVALTFSATAADLPARARPRTTGLPLRAAIAGFDRAALRAEALRAFGLDDGPATLFVTGGSLGARRLNEAAVAVAARWRDRGDRQMLVLAGRKAHAEVAGALAAAAGSMRAACLPFTDRMDLAYAAADLALCRGGGATVCELAAVSLPAIIVPYPYHRDRQQERNGSALAAAGGAVLLPDGEAGERAGELAEEILSDPARRTAMAAGAASFARPGAADELAAWALQLGGISITGDTGETEER